MINGCGFCVLDKKGKAIAKKGKKEEIIIVYII